MRSTVICSCTCAPSGNDNARVRAIRRRMSGKNTAAIESRPKGTCDMRVRALILLIACGAAAVSAAGSTFSDFFTDNTMRVDYFHTGNRGEEIFAPDRIVSDGPWPGSRTHLADTTNLGKYHFEVIDAASKSVIYSRGFASIFSEWETTDEAKDRAGTFHESLRFPWPKKNIQIVLKKRDKNEVFQKIWSIDIDPNSRFVNPATARPVGKLFTILDNGPASEKVDLLVIG